MVDRPGLAKLRPLIRRLYWAVTPAVHGRSRPKHVPDCSAAVPFAFEIKPFKIEPNICVICHLFYDDLADEMREVLRNIPFKFDLYVSTSDEPKRQRILAAFATLGRDIAPKLVTFSDVYNKYEYVLFVHGKKSAKSSVGQKWRDTLIEGLVGSPETVRSIITLFERHRSVGIVMTQHFEPIRAHLHWDHVFGRARKLAHKMGFVVTSRQVLDFPSGSMFWARTRALAPLLALELDYDDFPEEKGQTRRTIHHAIERLFLFTAEHAGFSWVKVASRDHYLDQSGIEIIDSPAKLDRFVQTGQFSLITS
jgi:lipopolysaccharide biosynthesis protein